MNQDEILVTKYMEKTELLNAFLALAFTSKTGLQETCSTHQGRIWSNEVQSPALGNEQAMHHYMLEATWLKSRTRGSEHKLKHRSLCLNMRKHLATVRVIQPWHRLPREIVESSSSEHSAV